jgi:ABC-type dipeptide/oligopeptide/nickel transport system ATPase component
MSETIIELRSVSKRFDSLWALRDVDLSVRRGEFLTLLGPSGCGETTLVTVHGRLKGFDRHLVEAAKDLGASEYQTVRHIILPLLLAVLAGWLLSSPCPWMMSSSVSLSLVQALKCCRSAFFPW